METKPTISELEANWHVHIAGIISEKKARSGGVSEADADTLLDAASGGRIIGGVKFPPISAGFMMLMAKANTIATKIPELANSGMDTDLGHMGALGLIMHSPELSWTMMKQPNGERLFADAVIEFAMQFNLGDFKQLVEWIVEEMKRLQSASSEGKPSAA
jgi:hypothetical protein